MRRVWLVSFFLLFAFAIHAQNIDSIYVHLYTDSLKRGTFNYINIDGLLSNGRYLPLDTTHIAFTTSHGKFSGNSLWVDTATTAEKINIGVALKSNSSVRRDFTLYIKKSPDSGKLKTEQEIIDEIKSKRKRKDG